MFSKATEYALRATIYIAQKGRAEHKISIEEIAEAIDAPRSFTAKILQTLRNDDTVIKSVSGPNGGFYMDEADTKLPVCMVLKAMQEEEVLNKCVLGLSKCSEQNPCPMHSKYKFIKAQLIELFESQSIQELAENMNNKDVFIGNMK